MSQPDRIREPGGDMTAFPGATHSRRSSQRAILREIVSGGPISRADLRTEQDCSVSEDRIICPPS